MSLRLRALQLRVLTADGEFGRDLRFDDGLVVLRAENSMGKTTATSSMLYALGMEGLIAQSQRVPLPPVMTSRLIGADDRELAVAESRVLLEVQNHDEDVLTFERYSKRRDGDTRLVRVWSAPRVTAPTPDDRYEDLLARVSGSGSGELGVGPRLERFVGWDLPQILMPDASERRLYPELILPLMFVEQRGGWRGIQAGMPSTYGIPDLRKRVREFVLGLSVYERERERLTLRREADAIRGDWTQAVRLSNARLNAWGLRLTSVPTAIDLDFGADTPLLAVDMTTGRPLDAERARVERELEALESRAEDRGDRRSESHDEEEQGLKQREATLHTAILDLREREQRIARQRREVADLEGQERRLGDDLTRNQDARRLQSFGSDVAWAHNERDCPTCHQALPPTLLGELDRPSMTIEQNIDFIGQQIELVSAARSQAQEAVDLAASQQTAARRVVSELRAEIRALRASLVGPLGAPSVADIQRRLLLERRREDLGAADVELGGLRDELQTVALRARRNAETQAALPRAGLTNHDEERLEILERSFVDQLREYRPQSVPLDDLGISRDSYLPAAGGYDLGFDISASDGIRLIWAYLLGLLETARESVTNHLGLVVFDEPRQQSAGDRSLQQLLRRASAAGPFGQQVLFATSEPAERLVPMLGDLNCQYVAIDGRLLQPLS